MNNKVLSIIKWVWLVAVLAGAGFYFFQNQETVLALIRQLSALRIGASLFLLLVAKLFIVLLVQFSVEAEGLALSFWETLGIYGSTALGKYIPGGVWHFVGRFAVYRAKGLNSKQTLRAFILENIWMLSAALVVGLAALLFYRLDLLNAWLDLNLSAGIAIGLFILVLCLWIAGLILVRGFIGRQTQMSIRPVWQVALAGVLLWIFAGLSFFVMFEAFPLQDFGLFVGGYAISWAVGYLAVFAPGGVGIRETMLVLVFASIGSAAQISVYAAMNRIIWVAAELLFGLAGYLQNPAKPGLSEEAPPDRPAQTQ